MDDGLDPVGPLQVALEIFGEHEVAEHALAQVHPARVLPQPVADHEIVATLLVQGGGDVGADEAGGAGDEDHAFTLTSAFPGASVFAGREAATSFVVDWPGTSSAVTTLPPAFSTVSAPTMSSIR